MGSDKNSEETRQGRVMPEFKAPEPLPVFPTLACFAGVLALVTFAAVYFHWSLNWGFWHTLVLLGGLSFACGLCLSGALVGRWQRMVWNREGQLEALRKLSEKMRYSAVDGWMLAVAVVAGVFMPFVILQIPSLGLRTSWAVVAFTWMPLIVLLVFPLLFDIFHRIRQSWMIALLSSVGYILVGLFFLVLIRDVFSYLGRQDWVRYLDRHVPLLEHFQAPFQGTLVGIALVFIGLGLIRVMALCRDESNITSPSAEAEGVEDGDETETPPDAALRRLIEEGRARFPEHGALQKLLHSAPFADNSPWEGLFNWERPTSKQNQFIDAFFENQLSVGNTERPSNWILSGPAGSGRSSALGAVALAYSLLTAGRVIWIAPHGRRRDSVRSRLQEINTGSGWPAMARIGSGVESIRSWTDEEDDAPCDICVVTVEDLQRECFDSLKGRDKSASVLEGRLFWCDLVVVDDWVDFSRSALRHLPFIVAKLRLLRAQDGLPIDWAISMPPLAEAAIDYLRENLFLDEPLEVFEMPTIPCPNTWVWTVYFDPKRSESDAPLQFVDLALTTGLKTLLFREGISPYSIQELKRKHPSSQLFVASELDDIHSEAYVDVAVLVCATSTESEELVAGMANPRGKRSRLIVRFVPSGTPAVATQSGVFPTVARRSRSYLGAMHSWDVGGMLPRGASMDAAYWRAVGVPRGEFLRLSGESAMMDKLVLKYDRSGNEDDWSGAPKTDWLLSRSVDHHGALNFEEPLAFGYEWLYSLNQLGEVRLLISETADQDKQRFLQWAPRESASSISGGRFDLAYARRLIFEEREMVYAPEPRTFSPGSGRHAKWEVAAAPWKGMHDFCVPSFQYQWEVGDFDDLGGHRGFGYRVFKALREDRLRIEFTGRLVSLATEYGLESHCADQPSFQYSTDSVLVLFESDDEMDILSPETLTGAWNSGSGRDSGSDMSIEPWPELHSAIAFGWRRRVPALADMATFSVFRVRQRGKKGASALFWMHEPWDSGDSAWPVVRAVLEDNSEPTVFWTNVKWFLERYAEVKEAAGRTAMTIRLTDQFVPARGDMEPVEAALGLVDGLLKLAIHRKDAGEHQREFDRLRDLPPEMLVPPQREPPSPDWDPTSPVMSWEECLKLIFHDLAEHDESQGLTFGSNATHDLVLILRLPSPADSNENYWDFSSVSALSVLGVKVLKRPDELRIVAGTNLKQSDFHRLLQDTFPQIMRELAVPDGTTVQFRLWIAPKKTEEDWPKPNPLKEVFVSVIGGYTHGGLLKGRKEPGGFPEPLIPLPIDPEPPLIPDPESNDGTIEPYATLPAAPQLNVETVETFKWEYEGKYYSVVWGFADEAQKEMYLSPLNSLKARPSVEGFMNFIEHDPYREQVGELAQELRRLHDEDHASGAESLARFCLTFVQSIVYVRDPRKETDWPMFPSEYLIQQGGDCEDSSYCLLALLGHLLIPAAFILYSDHAAVGVRGRFTGVHFKVDEGSYYIAETATSAQSLELGEDNGYSSGRVIPMPHAISSSSANIGMISSQIDGSINQIKVWFYARKTGKITLSVCVRSDDAAQNAEDNAYQSTGLEIASVGLFHCALQVPKPKQMGHLKIDLLLKQDSETIRWEAAHSFSRRGGF